MKKCIKTSNATINSCTMLCPYYKSHWVSIFNYMNYWEFKKLFINKNNYFYIFVSDTWRTFSDFGILKVLLSKIKKTFVNSPVRKGRYLTHLRMHGVGNPCKIPLLNTQHVGIHGLKWYFMLKIILSIGLLFIMKNMKEINTTY